jgi:carotenoid cleavage dioxygenase
MGRDSWVGVMPRYGDVAQMRWFRGPKGVFCFHMMNAFEDAEGRIQFDQCLSNVNVFPFIQRASGLNVPPPEAGSRLARWMLDLGSGRHLTETVIGPLGDMPVTAAFQGRPYTHAWMLTMNPEMRGPPVLGGPVGAMFNTLLRLDFTGSPPQAFGVAPGCASTSRCTFHHRRLPTRRDGRHRRRPADGAVGLRARGLIPDAKLAAGPV